MIENYNEFIEGLLAAGFSVAGGNDEGVFGLINHGWQEEPPESPLRWHTGNPDTDPWEWRIRVLNERSDIAYAKLFNKKGGFITREWYPYFLAARRNGKLFEEEYADGKASHYAKRIYEVLVNNALPAHQIKQAAGFAKEEKLKFDNALVELQMKLYITVCGEQQKISQKGDGYSWASMVYCTTDQFWGDEVFMQAAAINSDEAIAKITKQAMQLNPAASDKKVLKFIKG